MSLHSETDSEIMIEMERVAVADAVAEPAPGAGDNAVNDAATSSHHITVLGAIRINMKLCRMFLWVSGILAIVGGSLAIGAWFWYHPCAFVTSDACGNNGDAPSNPYVPPYVGHPKRHVEQQYGPTTTTNGFRSPSTTFATVSTTVRPLSDLIYKATDVYATIYDPSTTLTTTNALPTDAPTINNLSEQAASLFELQKSLSEYQSAYNKVMKEDMHHLITAMIKGDIGASMKLMGDIFAEMGNYEMFLEDIITGLEDDVVSL